MDKQEILALLKGEDPAKGIKELKSQGKDSEIIQNHKDEYQLKRGIRDTQIDNIQIDKVIKDENGIPEVVKLVKSPINFQKKIVSTATAFEFGAPPKISAKKTNPLTDLVLELWDTLRMDSKLQKASIITKSETESCIVFYFSGEGSTRKIRCKVNSSNTGKMTPYFDEYQDMKFFTWEFAKIENEKKIYHTWVYDEENIYQFKNINDDDTSLINTVPHGFGVIPIAYYDQENVEYEDVKGLIDRYEISLSKLGDANDYTGHPMLFFNGEVKGLPKKGNSGKVLQSPITIDKTTGKESTGDAKFLTYENAPQSVKLELEQLRDFIGYITSTPDLSFNTLKSLGNVATETLQLMFLDPILKAMLREGENRTLIQRCLNIIASGSATTLKTNLSSYLSDNKYKITFQSILPNNLTELMNNMANGKESGIVSPETAVSLLSLTDDNEVELNRINNDKIAEINKED